MAVTDEQLQEMRKAVEDAREELERINEERIISERETENDRVAAELKREYERIQAAIAQAKGLNARATDQPVERDDDEKAVSAQGAATVANESATSASTSATVRASENPVFEAALTPPKPEVSAPVKNATAEGK